MLWRKRTGRDLEDSLDFAALQSTIVPMVPNGKIRGGIWIGGSIMMLGMISCAVRNVVVFVYSVEDGIIPIVGGKSTVGEC